MYIGQERLTIMIIISFMVQIDVCFIFLPSAAAAAAAAAVVVEDMVYDDIDRHFRPTVKLPNSVVIIVVVV